MQRKEWPAGPIGNTHKGRNAAMRAADPNPSGGGGGLLDSASGSAHVELLRWSLAFLASLVRRSPRDPASG